MIRAIHGGSGRRASKREDRRFGAIIFGWHGTAVPDRPADASDVLVDSRAAREAGPTREPQDGHSSGASTSKVR